jgi:hypothetical protein
VYLIVRGPTGVRDLEATSPDYVDVA